MHKDSSWMYGVDEHQWQITRTEVHAHDCLCMRGEERREALVASCKECAYDRKPPYPRSFLDGAKKNYKNGGKIHGDMGADGLRVKVSSFGRAT